MTYRQTIRKAVMVLAAASAAQFGASCSDGQGKVTDGQTLEGDQLDEVIARMGEADVIVMGSPVYWHNICASMRTLMERFYGYLPENAFRGKSLYFLYQGAAPTQMMIDDGEYTMSRFAGMYGITYQGMATNRNEARELSNKLNRQ
ncbi:MAG: flavodoxin family protein [Candidatus Cryptobacteroides sp.]